MGEHVFGAGKGYNDVIFVTLGTGVGTGFIIDGKLFEAQRVRRYRGRTYGHQYVQKTLPFATAVKEVAGRLTRRLLRLWRQTKESMDKHPESLMHKFAKEEGKVSGKTALWRLSKAIKQVGKL